MFNINVFFALLVTITVQIKNSGSPVMGKDYPLNCNYTVTGNLIRPDTINGYNYVWFKDGQVISKKSNESTFTIPKLTIDDSVDYSCQISFSGLPESDDVSSYASPKFLLTFSGIHTCNCHHPC